jgi:hypothetical protein
MPGGRGRRPCEGVGCRDCSGFPFARRVGTAGVFTCAFPRVRVCGCVGVWVCGCVGVWVCGCVGVWVCGCVGVWVCGCACVWVCGCVGVWVCGCVGVWVCGCVGVWAGAGVCPRGCVWMHACTLVAFPSWVWALMQRTFLCRCLLSGPWTSRRTSLAACRPGAFRLDCLVVHPATYLRWALSAF